MEDDNDFSEKMKIKFYEKNSKTRVKKISLPLNLETMKQLMIRPWRRSLAPGAGKKFKNQKYSKNLKTIAKIFQNACDI